MGVAPRDGGAGKNHVDLVTQHGFVIECHLGVFFHGLRFAGQGRFDAGEIAACDQPAVGRDRVAFLEKQDVSRHHLIGIDLAQRTVTQDFGGGVNHLLQGFDRFLRLQLGEKTGQDRDQKRDDNRDPFDVVAHVKGQDGCGQQQVGYQVVEVVQEYFKRGDGLAAFKPVRTVFGQTIGRFVRRQALGGLTGQGLDDVIRIAFVRYHDCPFVRSCADSGWGSRCQMSRL